MNQEKFNTILKRYLAGEATEEEKQIIDSWYDDMGYQSEKLSDDSAGKGLEDEYWNVISKKLGKSDSCVKGPAKERTMGKVIKYSLGIAASVAILGVAISYFLYFNQIAGSDYLANYTKKKAQWSEIINLKENEQMYSLADGTKIILEPGSSVKVDADFDKTSRNVKLSGKAFFEVAHNPSRPFRVFANGVTTKVLGTSFFIEAYEDQKDVKVSVKTGKVSIYRTEEHEEAVPEVILTPNHQIIFDKEKKTIAKGIVEEPQPLIELAEIKDLRFEAAPLREIFKAMEKIYGVDIIFDEENYSSCKLTTSLVNGGLYDRLNIVTSAIGATYSINENVIRISGNGCN